jgi:hypothetical protein
MPSAATKSIHPVSTDTKAKSETTKNGGCPDTTRTPNGRQNANAEAVFGGSSPADPENGFLTANGSRDSHAIMLASGRANPSRRAGQPYGRITWAGIRRLVAAPAAVPKDRGAFVILSTYVEHDARTHAVQRERGAFHGLAVDIDTGSPELAQVVAAVRAVIGNHAALVYSSASAAPDRRKWRVLVPLATPLHGAEYEPTQLALFALLADHGLECDAALARTGQPVYLPNVPPERRDVDGAPRFYQSAVLDGPALELDGHAIADHRDAMVAEELAAAEAAAERTTAFRAQRLATLAATGDTFDAIEHFNETHTVGGMLARYGFTPNPSRPAHYRHPESQTGSHATEDRGDHWVCVSSWAATMDCGRATKSGHRAGDAFDLFTAFEHGGNRSAAVRAYAAEVRPRRAANPNQGSDLKAPAPLPPAGRVEILEPRRVVPVETIRETVEEQIRWACTERPALAVVRAGTAAAKTTTAVRVGAETPGRIVWNVQSHAAAAQVVAMHHAIGHMDAAAVPPRDETTCRCWTGKDAERLAEEHGGRPGLSMERAMAVGMPILACSQCPLSGMNREHRARAAVTADRAAELDFLADSGWDVQAVESPADATCEYWTRTNHAMAQRVLVQCQQRTERQPDAIAPEGWEQVTVFTDENALGVLQPRVLILPEELAAVRDVLKNAAANYLAGKVKSLKWNDARSRAYELARWAEAVAKVADRALELCTTLESAGTAVLEPVVVEPVDPETVPRAPHRKLLWLISGAELPDTFTPAAFELCRMLAVGEPTGAMLRVAADAGGKFHASVHRSWSLELDFNVCHIVLDATVDVDALQRIRPDAVVLDPPGAAACVHQAEQWWQEISPRTSPAVVVDTIERVLDAKGWNRAALMLCKSHRDVLFPRTRPNNGVPMDKPANVDAIAAWNAGRVSTTAASTDARQRAAEELARRVDRIRDRLARDAHGNVVVEHHRGSRSRGSNAFMADAGVDGLAVIGHTRTNPVDIVGHLLATGMVDAVAAGDGSWGDVDGELPHTDGTTRRMRWRGYGCPHWAAAARGINRADLEQTAARGRPNLDGGVPVLVVAAEPCGLPLADPPARLPAGVAAVVDAIRRLTGGGAAQVAGLAGAAGGGAAGTDGAAEGLTGGGCQPGSIGNRSIGHGGGMGGESGQRSIGHTPSPILIERWPDTLFHGVPVDALVSAIGMPERSARRAVADAMAMGLVERHGAARATRYTLATPAPTRPAPATTPPPAATSTPPPARTVAEVVAHHRPPPPTVDAFGTAAPPWLNIPPDAVPVSWSLATGPAFVGGVPSTGPPFAVAANGVGYSPTGPTGPVRAGPAL